MNSSKIKKDLQALIDSEAFLISKQDHDYDDSRMIFNRMHDRRPAVIVQPWSTSCVPKVVKYCRDNGLPMAIRGGGHHIAGYSVIENGVVLDFRRLRNVSINGDDAIVSPGALLCDVDNKLVPLNRTIPLGTVSQTGVAGLTLGGGIGWLTGSLGATCDFLKSVEIVTAEGEICEISDENDKETMWALRGGNKSIGVITSFRFTTNFLNRTFCGTLRMWVDDHRTLTSVRALSDWLNSGVDKNLTIAILLQTVNGRTELSLDFCSHGDSASSIKDLISIFPHACQDNLGIWDFRKWQCKDDHLFAVPLRGYWKPLYFEYISADLLEQILVQSRNMPTGTSITIEHLHGQFTNNHNSALPIRNCKIGVLFTTRWKYKFEDTIRIDWIRTATNSFNEFYPSNSVYFNYAMSEDIHHDRIIDNKRLENIKLKWDPQNFFRRVPSK